MGAAGGDDTIETDAEDIPGDHGHAAACIDQRQMAIGPQAGNRLSRGIRDPLIRSQQRSIQIEKNQSLFHELCTSNTFNLAEKTQPVLFAGYSLCYNRAIEKPEDWNVTPVIDENRCIGCGLCERICPSLFKVDCRRIARVTGRASTDEEMERLDAAADYCPVRAIGV
jgi:ferredoxin